MDNYIPGNIGLIMFLTITSSVITGCTTMYIPTMQNMPLLKEKGDLQAILSNKNFQLTYAPSDQAAVFVNYKRKSRQLAPPLYDGKSWHWSSSTYAIEGGLGIYKRNKRDLFVGYGEGFSSISYGEPAGTGGGSSHFRKVFSQTNLYISNEKKPTQIAIGLRVTILDFYDFIDFSGASINTYPIFLEPSFMCRKNLNKVELKFQMQYSSGGGDLDESFSPYSKYKPYHNSLLIFLSLEFYLDKIFPGIKPWKKENK